MFPRVSTNLNLLNPLNLLNLLNPYSVEYRSLNQGSALFE